MRQQTASISVFRGAFFALSLGFLSGVSHAQNTLGPSPDAAPSGSVMAAWTQISGNGPAGANDALPLTGFARFILAGRSLNCSVFSLDVGPGVPSPTIDTRQNLAPQDFPVTVCEVAMSSDWQSATLTRSGQPVAMWQPGGGTSASNVTFPTLQSVGRRNKGILRMVTLGDTGCRDRSDQPCTTSDTWPFGVLAQNAASQNADFAVHVGDYRYSHKGEADTWTYWYEEFFYPAQALSASTPWAFIRGNHESCGYDGSAGTTAPWGTGWFLFLDQSNAPSTPNCFNMKPSYLAPWTFDVAIKFGIDVSDRHRFVMMDSSTDNPSPKQTANFTTMLNQTAASDSAWWVGHRPIWAINNYPQITSMEANLELSLVEAIKAAKLTSTCWPTDNLPCGLKTMLAGHIHRLQRIQFFDGAQPNWLRPMQYIAGNSGVVPVSAFANNPCGYTVPDVDPSIYGTNLDGSMDWSVDFGFTIWERNFKRPSGWQETRHYYIGGAMRKEAPPAVTPGAQLGC